MQACGAAQSSIKSLSPNASLHSTFSNFLPTPYIIIFSANMSLPFNTWYALLGTFIASSLGSGAVGIWYAVEQWQSGGSIFHCINDSLYVLCIHLMGFICGGYLQGILRGILAFNTTNPNIRPALCFGILLVLNWMLNQTRRNVINMEAHLPRSIQQKYCPDDKIESDV
jgi:hypothetical protein